MPTEDVFYLSRVKREIAGEMREETESLRICSDPRGGKNKIVAIVVQNEFVCSMEKLATCKNDAAADLLGEAIAALILGPGVKNGD